MKVYIIYKNADLTEGRGPMVPNGKAFFSEEVAVKYIEEQKGVQGFGGRKAEKQRFGGWYANDHEVKEIEVE